MLIYATVKTLKMVNLYLSFVVKFIPFFCVILKGFYKKNDP